MDWEKRDRCMKEHEAKKRNAGKEHYRLSQAIRSGRQLNMGRPHAKLDVLALIGDRALQQDDTDPHSRADGMLVSDAYSGDAVVQRHPWLKDPLLCQWCAKKVEGAQIMLHALEEHPDEVDEDEQIDWIEEIEDEVEMRASALAVFLRNERERQQVLDAAERLNLTPSAFIAGALRFVLEHDLRVREDCGVLQ